MNKKVIGLLTAAAVSVSGAAMLAASAENTVTVVVNGAQVDYEDQQPVIENDRTLIPVRGAFEAMGAKVDWDGETRTVTVKDSTGTRYAFVTIGSDIMETHTYKSLFDVDKAEVKLDVPAQIMNDRTMIPLRAVGEALGAEVDWDGATYTATITSKTVSEEKKSSLLGLSLSQAESENEDEVVISVDLSNMEQYSDSYVGGVTLGLNYDPSALEFVSAALYNGDTKVDSAMGAENPKFSDNRLKAAYITIDSENGAKTDGSVMKLVFKKLSNEASKVSISTSYSSKLGYDTSIIISSIENSNSDEYDGLKLNIDTSELEIK